MCADDDDDRSVCGECVGFFCCLVCSRRGYCVMLVAFVLFKWKIFPIICRILSGLCILCNFACIILKALPQFGSIIQFASLRIIALLRNTLVVNNSQRTTTSITYFLRMQIDISQNTASHIRQNTSHVSANCKSVVTETSPTSNATENIHPSSSTPLHLRFVYTHHI